MLTALLAAGLLLIADKPGADQPKVTASTPAAAAAHAETNPDQMVCVKTEQIGSRFPKSECRTRSEWRQLTQDSKDLLDDITRHRSGNPAAGG